MSTRNLIFASSYFNFSREFANISRLAIHSKGVPVQFNTLPSLRDILQSCRKACTTISKVVKDIYKDLNDDSDLSTKKADSSYFTIADGLVQCLLFRLLSDKVGGIVGEEDVQVNIETKPYNVADIPVPSKFEGLIDEARDVVDALKAEVPHLPSLTCFVDPIDGTKEFATGLGEQCTILVGFADEFGSPVAGIIYRPITDGWAAGCHREGYKESQGLACPNPSNPPSPPGFCTSNGGVSPFLVDLMNALEMPQVRSGGAGNKGLLLLEGKGRCYIQDRGVSRWDTCATEAVVKAFGGKFAKLSTFIDATNPTDTESLITGYTYLPTSVNLDPNPLAAKTKYNSEGGEFKVYSNLCGHVGLAPGEDVTQVWEAMQKVVQAGAVVKYD